MTTTNSTTSPLAQLSAAEAVLAAQARETARALDTIGSTLPAALADLDRSADAAVGRINEAFTTIEQTALKVVNALQQTAARIASLLASNAAAGRSTAAEPIAPTAPVPTVQTATTTTSEPPAQVEPKADTASDVITFDTTITPTSDTAIEVTAVAANKPAERDRAEDHRAGGQPDSPPGSSDGSTATNRLSRCAVSHEAMALVNWTGSASS
jgi:hypothetical protein